MRKIFSSIIAGIILAILFSCAPTTAKCFTIEQAVRITAMEKGTRPAPSTYLSKRYIRNHLKKFRNGVSIVMGLESYNKYVVPSKTIGRADGCFVMPKYICDEIDKKFGGDISVYEKSLSFTEGYFSSQGGLVRLDIFEISDLNLRMSDGNEEGANSYWLSGGFTMGAIPEAVVDPIPKERARVKFY